LFLYFRNIKRIREILKIKYKYNKLVMIIIKQKKIINTYQYSLTNLLSFQTPSTIFPFLFIKLPVPLALPSINCPSNLLPSTKYKIPYPCF
jgi:hypothetical protein